jgi:tetratricopeptide (TPR) repeat protein
MKIWRMRCRRGIAANDRAVNVFLALAVLLINAATADPAERRQAVRAWAGEISLPTTVEGLPNPNPPFDLFATGRFNYPYTLRDALTDRRSVVRYQALFLENEYLKITVLPELGGHVYSCLDKVSGREMFYANRSIKKALIGYRGAWAAFGIEFNFPVSHNWMSMSPVDAALVRNPDGGASIWVGNVDAVFGSSWRVELRLRPGRAVLEQHTTLFNAGDARHRYYWWTNAAVEVGDDSVLIYPTHLMATHGFTAIQTWPVDASGHDLSVIRNQADGPVSLFTYGTREPFIGVWHPSTRNGTVHVTSVDELPTSKLWSWGFDRDAHEWRQALSDDRSAYIELQAGLFRNQETYAFLGPQERVGFSEYWLPVRDMDGIMRATVDAVFHAERHEKVVTFELNVTRALAGARVLVRHGNTMSMDEAVTLWPRHTWRRRLDSAPRETPWTFELQDPRGVALLAHEEGKYDALTSADVQVGRQAAHRFPPVERRSEGDFVELGQDMELNGRRLEALDVYRAGLNRFEGSLGLNKAAGRLATSLHWVDAATKASAAAKAEMSLPIQWLERAFGRDTTDVETRYYLGLAREAAGDTREARAHFEAAQRFALTRTPARLQLARLAARAGEFRVALASLSALLADDPGNALAGAMEVGCLRRAGQMKRARERLAYRQRRDPIGSLLRYEAIRLGSPDQGFWRHLAADPTRILDIVDQYLAVGSMEDAWIVLDHQYPEIGPPASEPGVRSPSAHSLIAYYRAFVGERLGRTGADAYQHAAALSARYVFPNRASTYPVLDAAMQANPDDGTALFLRGCLYLSSGLVSAAIADWQRAQALAPATPTLHRNLGMTLLHEGRLADAIAVLQEGVAHDARNVEVYTALDQAFGAADRPVAERVGALERYPDRAGMPQALVYKLALARAEQGDGDGAEALFRDRFFPREEGGTSPARVLVATRLVAARRAARLGRCDDATRALDGVTRVGRGIALAADALESVAHEPLFEMESASIEAACGRTDRAKERRIAIARANAVAGGPLQLALAFEASRAVGEADSEESRAGRQRVADTLGETLESGEADSPGTIAYLRARLLASLGRADLARESLTAVFRYPDRNLSHVFARLLREDLSKPETPVAARRISN